MRHRAEELDDLDTAGTITEDEMQELRDLSWPSYFARNEDATPRPAMWSSRAASDALWLDLVARLPELEASLPTISVPVGVLAAEGSPIPPAASQDTVERIPGAWLQLEPEVGHFPWLERPGLVRSVLDRLARSAAAT